MELIDGNQITAYLQLFMQGAISQATLLAILQQGEVLPPTVDLEKEIIETRDFLEEQAAADALRAAMDKASNSTVVAGGGSVRRMVAATTSPSVPSDPTNRWRKS